MLLSSLCIQLILYLFNLIPKYSPLIPNTSKIVNPLLRNFQKHHIVDQPHCGGLFIPVVFAGGLAAVARSRIPLICLTTCSSVFHSFHSPIPIPVASGSSLPVLFLYFISLSTKRPALKWISLSPSRRRITTRIWTVFGLIPEPGRIVIGSIGGLRTFDCEGIEEME